MTRHVFWDLFAGMGLFGLVLGIATLQLGVVCISALILVAAMIHYERVS